MGDQADGLGDVEWTLVELDGLSVEAVEGERVYLVLDLEESRVAGSGGCNRVSGSFALAADRLRFGALATTRMACPDDVLTRERAFLAHLERVTGYRLEERSLTLLEGDRATVRLAC